MFIYYYVSVCMTIIVTRIYVYAVRENDMTILVYIIISTLITFDTII